MNRAIIMDEDRLNEIIREAPNENDHWDFKAEWYHTQSELIRDIINFANTVHRDDCYIILGIDDSNGNVLGIEEDEHRRNRQQVQDLLRSVQFSSNGYPRTDVNTFKVQGHDVDVLTIQDTDAVPYYLQHKYTAKSGRPLPAGLIYSRINDSNTPVNESTTDDQMQRLWKKRLHLDRSIQERFKFNLARSNQWSSVSDSDKMTYIFNDDPDYVLEMVEDDESRKQYEAFSCSQFVKRLGWGRVNLKFRGTLIKYELVNYFDDARLWTCTPIYALVYLGGKEQSTENYYCYVEGEWEYLLAEFFINHQYAELGSTDSLDHAVKNLHQDTVWYRSLCEKNEAEKYVSMHLAGNDSKIQPEETRVKSYASSAKLVQGSKLGHIDDYEAKVILRQHMVVQYINQQVLPVLRNQN
ncbi:ATP-binding protein [Lacticaseibacillus paracasei]|uniref:ATP-binding protein n=1 Tax=Lacticaseibacillus paracasei TaxID=1597 RepID=UPI000C2D0BAB|nr:ATP-binding protein [Lacticaseibacillus paracasei]AUC01982.1 DNA-binding protein [Lacticaseibacillus paracasei subsp. paracasei]